MISPLIENCIVQVAERILDAVLKYHRHDDAGYQKVLNYDGLNPLGAYFERVAFFVLPRELTAETAIQFRDTILEPDAHDYVFSDALAVFKKSGVAPDLFRIFDTTRIAARLFIDTAYLNAPALPQQLTREPIFILFNQKGSIL